MAAAIAVAIVAVLSQSSPPPSAYQQCVTSIQQQPPGQVTGYTPQCLKLTVQQRLAAIKQATSQQGDG